MGGQVVRRERARPARRRRSTRSGGPPRGAASAGRGARASRRRPRGSAPGGTRTGRAPGSAGPPRRGPGRCRTSRSSRPASSPRGHAAHRAQGRDLERLPQHRGVLEQRPVGGVEARRGARRSARGASPAPPARRAPRRARTRRPRARPGGRRRRASGSSRRRTAGCPRRGPRSSRTAGSGSSGASPPSSCAHRRLVERLQVAGRGTPRLPAPQSGRRSRSSGRASVMIRIGTFRLHSSRCSMKSSVPGSAHWRSSNSERDRAPRTASRSKKVRQAPEQLRRAAGRRPPPTPSSASSAGSRQRALRRVRHVLQRASPRSARGSWPGRPTPAARRATGPSRPAPRT